jgi:hypothetical protein
MIQLCCSTLEPTCVMCHVSCVVYIHTRMPLWLNHAAYSMLHIVSMSLFMARPHVSCMLTLRIYTNSILPKFRTYAHMLHNMFTPLRRTCYSMCHAILLSWLIVRHHIVLEQMVNVHMCPIMVEH